jgi:hypothetical protein
MPRRIRPQSRRFENFLFKKLHPKLPKHCVLTRPPWALADSLAMDEVEYFDYEFPRFDGALREVNFE